MNKYKICPECNKKNEPYVIECIYCEAELTGVKITDEETENTELNNTNVQTPVVMKMIRLCDCGNKNPANARKCSICNEDISDITPIPDTKETQTLSFILNSMDGQYAYTISKNEIIIGRENVMSDYLINKKYVGRSQAKLTINNNELWIENLSGTNPTFVNNKKITEKTKLSDGDEIGLGGIVINGSRQEQAAYFLVRIGSCI